MMAKKVPRPVEIFPPQWTSGILPTAKKTIVPGLYLNHNQTQGHQRQCSKGPQRERPGSYKEYQMDTKVWIWRGDIPYGEVVRLPRRDKNWTQVTPVER